MEELASVINNFARLILYAGGGVFTIAVCVAGFFLHDGVRRSAETKYCPWRPGGLLRGRLHHGRGFPRPQDHESVRP